MNRYLHLTADYAVEQLENYIEQHQLSAHERIPSERVLSATFGINRITLREAIRRLENEHVLYSIVGSGTYVAPPKLRTNTGVNFSFNSYCEANHYIGSSRVIYFEKTIGTEYVCRKLEIAPYSPIFVLKRLRLINDKPAMIETTHISEVLCPELTRYDFYNPLQSLYKILTDEYGISPQKTRYHVSMIYSDTDSSYYLNLKNHTPLLSFDIISSTENDQVIEYCQTLKRADYFGINSNLFPAMNQ